MRFRTLHRLASLSLLLACCAAHAAPAKANSAQVLMLSDIHFDPFHDPAKVPALLSAPVSEWHRILSAPDAPDQPQAFADLQLACKAKGIDTPMPLLTSALAAAHTQLPHPLFITVSGDLTVHKLDCLYQKFYPAKAKSAPDTYDADYSAFSAKIVAFVALELHQAYPGVPVYFALGNNDSGCKDYREDEGSDYLKADAKSFAAVSGDPGVLKQFPALGNYSVALPHPFHNTRLLVMQDIFESKKFATCGGTESGKEGNAQVAWLRGQLAAARLHHERVWVMAHIPPGVDAFSTVKAGLLSPAGSCPYNKPEMFLNSELLADALRDYADVIRLVLLGHTHMDEMRLYTAKTGTAAAPGKLVPSISPVDGNNPSFTVSTVDPARALLVDYTVFAASDKQGRAWSPEYTYSTTYGLPDYSGASLAQLTGRLRNDTTSANPQSRSYESFYFVGAAAAVEAGSKKSPGVLGAVWPVYTCSLTNDHAEGFAACACATK